MRPGRRIYVRGYPQSNGRDVNFAATAGPISAEDVAGWAGSFAVIVIDATEITLITDQIRSVPVFYRRTERGWWVGDDPEAVLDGCRVIDVEAARWFPHAGFVTGSRTLFAGLSQVRAGELVVLNGEPPYEATQRLYRRFSYSQTQPNRPDEVKSRFDTAFTAGFDRMLGRVNGRQLVVPLSGGLDSRLLSARLHSIGYDNVVNFTYGRPGSSEIAVSKRVAELLEQPWHFVPYEPTEIAHAWATEEAGRFIEYGHSASAVPHVQDWYALSVLKQRGVLDADAVILPGHTVVGNINAPGLLDEPGLVSREQMKEVLADYHFSLLGRSREVLAHPEIDALLERFLADIEYDGTPRSRATAMEYFNVAERQAKYINNSVRVYEFFGFDWALPMLDTEMYLMWQSLDIDITRDRSWYQNYVDQVFAAQTGTEIGYFAPTSVRESTRGAVKSVLRAVGLEEAAQRVLTTRAVLHHHMTFNRLIGPMSQAQLGWRTLRGQSLVGIYGQLFLRDAWNPYTRVFH